MGKKAAPPTALVKAAVESVAIEKLFLDEENPRLAGVPSAKRTQDEIIKVLWQEREVSELLDSISRSGFWRTEPLLAIEREKGTYTIIEGNRRLAAAKLLRDAKLRKSLKIDEPEIRPGVAETLNELPIIVTTRDNVWQYLGFKHVNGPQEWDSIAKAEYIAKVHEDFEVPLDEIASQIGDRHNTVKRLYQGLVVLRQAENANKFNRTSGYKRSFPFSHLWTGLGYPNVQKFLGITAKSPEGKPVPKGKLDELGELCLWMFGSKADDVAPIVKSQNPHLRELDEALGTDRGVAALRRGLPLSSARDASRGDKRLFIEALVAAEENLRTASGLLATGSDGSPEQVRTAESIAKLATDIEDRLNRSVRTGGRQRGR